MGSERRFRVLTCPIHVDAVKILEDVAEVSVMS